MELKKSDYYRILSDVWLALSLFHPNGYRSGINWKYQILDLLTELETDFDHLKFEQLINLYLINPLDDYLTSFISKTPSSSIKVQEMIWSHNNDYSVLNISSAKSIEVGPRLVALKNEILELEQPLVVDLRWTPQVMNRRQLLAFPFLFVNERLIGDPTLYREHKGWADPEELNYEGFPYRRKEVINNDIILDHPSNLSYYALLNTMPDGLPKDWSEDPITQSVILLINKVSLSVYWQYFSILRKQPNIFVILDTAGSNYYPDATLDGANVDEFFKLSWHNQFELVFPRKLLLLTNEFVGIGFDVIGHNMKIEEVVSMDFSFTHEIKTKTTIPVPKTDVGYLMELKNLYSFLKYWQIIRYFHPTLDLIEISWETIWDKYINQFLQGVSHETFKDTMRKIMISLKDKHAYFHFKEPDTFYPKMLFYTAENRVFCDDVSCVSVIEGPKPEKYDEVIAVNGSSIEDLVKNQPIVTSVDRKYPYEKYFGNQFHIGRTRMPKGEPLILTLKRGLEEFNVSIACELDIYTHLLKEFPKGNPVQRFDDIGYICLGNLKSYEQLDDAVASFSDTIGLIIDNRGYGHMNTWRLLDRFMDVDSIHLGYTMIPLRQSPITSNQSIPSYESHPYTRNKKWKGEAYTKPIVIINSTKSASMSEGNAVDFDFLAHITSMGRPTAGAWGVISSVHLTDGHHARFGGFRTNLVDGRTINIFGIRPDIIVDRKVSDYLAGSDTEIKAALEYLRKTARSANDNV